MKTTAQEYPGLTPGQVKKAREQHGGNALPSQARHSFFKQLLQSFSDPIIKILLAALCINLLFLFHHFDWFESAGIAVAVLLATVVSTVSEYGSQAAFEKMQRDADAGECRVRRAGQVHIVPVDDLVVGDIVLLQAGERIPADGVMVSGEVRVDQSALNGESREVRKSPYNSGVQGLLSANEAFRGTVVTDGQGEMQLRAVGVNTTYGAMVGEMHEGTRESPMKLRLAHLARTISRLGYAAAGMVLIADLFNAFFLSCGMDMALVRQMLSDWPTVVGNIMHAVTLAITVVVVAVPEGLPMMITVVLSSNMVRMMRDNVLVRKLVGIETAGSLNILFTDKTGTLTKGQLELCRIVTGDGQAYSSVRELRRHPAFMALLEQSGRYNTASMVAQGRVTGGNATDRALLAALSGIKSREAWEIEKQQHFSSQRKYSAVQIRRRDKRVILVKGAPERILERCEHYYDTRGERRSLASKGQLKARWLEMTHQSHRVLALATARQWGDSVERFGELTLIALVGIRDDVRPEAAAAVQQIQGAGVQVVMITGDNRDTAAQIAREAGLHAGEDGAVMSAEELQAMDDDALRSRLPALRVVARALPADKSRLVRVAQEMGLVAGMTGDGVNDAPALKRADVGFSMGSGTEVAKEAGDIVIMDDNIASIAKAMLYGRTIFKSIRKFIVFQLTMNLCAVGVSIIGPFIGVDAPVTVMQMLWINIIMDTLAGLAFAGEAPLMEYMREAPKRRDEPIMNRYMAGQILFMGLFTVASLIVFLKVPQVQAFFGGAGSQLPFLTGFFAIFVFCGIFNSFNARTPRINLLAYIGRNPMFILIMGAVVAVQLGLIYFGGSLFRTVPLTPAQLGLCAAWAALVVPADILRKIIMRLRGKSDRT